MSKVYISLPISHLDIDERRQYAENVERTLLHFFNEVVNPMKNGLPADAHPSEHMRIDFKNLLECDTIYMCKGWEDSAGCRGEHIVASLCHINIKYETDKSEYFR